MSESKTYQHDLGNGFFLNSYSVDPSITQESLKEMVISKDGKPIPDLENLISNTIFIDKIDSTDKFEIEISDEIYRVPEQLQPYREAVEFQSDSIGRYNGNVLIVDGRAQIPLKSFTGGFYDFIATNLSGTPYKSEEEFEILTRLPKDSLFWKVFSKAGGEKKARELYDKLKGKYKKGETIEELFNREGIDINKRARYLGFAHLIKADNGKEITFVQRAKGMAIAADCISSGGSTPNPNFNDKSFNINEYFKRHLTEEMHEEYNLSPSEFNIGCLYLFDDKKQVPFANVEIITPLKTKELAQRIYGKQEAIKEHPVLYSANPEAINKLIERFPLFPPFVQSLKVFNKYQQNN